MSKNKIIIDTNLIVSRLLTPSSSTAQIVKKILYKSIILASQATINELREILERLCKKGLIRKESTNRFIDAYVDLIEFIPIKTNFELCRDVNDNKFLDLAYNGKADYLLTGDKDLLVINKFHNTIITTAKNYYTSAY